MSSFTVPRTEQHDPFYRYRMPAMSLKVEGKGKMIKTRITNIGAVAKALSIPEGHGASTPAHIVRPEYIVKWLAVALSTNCDEDYVCGDWQVTVLQDLLDRFISFFVCCPNCDKPETWRESSGTRLVGHCRVCGWSGPLQTSGNKDAERLEKYIAKDLATETTSQGLSRKQKKAELQRRAAKKKLEKDLGGSNEGLVENSADVSEERHRAPEPSGEADEDEGVPSAVLTAQSRKEMRKANRGRSSESECVSNVPTAPIRERDSTVRSANSSIACTSLVEGMLLNNTMDDVGLLGTISEENDDLRVDETVTDQCVVEGALAFKTVTLKQYQRQRMKQNKSKDKDAVADDISFFTVTEHAPSNAVKADGLCLSVGNALLLEGTKFTISDDAQCRRYGLIGPNGCGKTTLMRLIAGRYAPQHRVAMPSVRGTAWDCYLVDQLDPEPTGRSPLEEVLAGCPERAELLEQQGRLNEELDHLCDVCTYDGRDYSDEEISRINEITEEIQDIDHKLSKFDKDVQDVTRILVGLGFSDGDEPGSDGAPSLNRKDELVTDISSLEINSCVEVRDESGDEWLRGVVTSLDPAMVQPDGWTESCEWVELRRTSELSGGWRKKVNLAKALYVKPRLLLLDEPTNHLDFHALLWLEEELKAYPHVVLIVSHNSEFLANACDRVLHITNKEIKTIPIKDLSPEDIANKQRQVEHGSRHKDWRFAYPSGDDPDMHGLSFHDVSFQYSSGGPMVVQGLDHDPLRFSGRSRTVILGRNGSGKSTILKLALGIIPPTKGDIDGRYGENCGQCKVGHFSQHFNEELDRHPEDSAASYLARKCKTALVQRFKSTDEGRLRERATEVLGWFGLSPEAARKRSLKDLSGGQKARVNFAYLSLEPVHLIFLDEPTNHLDASGLEHLAEAVKAFEGGIVLVSHDEVLIRKVLNSAEHSRLLVCQDGALAAQRPAGSHGLTSYRLIAFRDQQEKAARAAVEAARRLAQSRQKSVEAAKQARGGRRVRGRKREAAEPLSAVSSVAPSPSLSRGPSPGPKLMDNLASGAPSKQPTVEDSKHPTLQDVFKEKTKKKAANINMNQCWA